MYTRLSYTGERGTIHIPVFTDAAILCGCGGCLQCRVAANVVAFTSVRTSNVFLIQGAQPGHLRSYYTIDLTYPSLSDKWLMRRGGIDPNTQ